MKLRNSIASSVLILALLVQACGGGFAGNLRSILALSTPLVDSLVASNVIPASARDTYLKDFADLISGAATLKETLDACPIKDNPCKLEAVDKYQGLAFEVFNRGNLVKVGKLAKIQTILEGIIAAARIHYGAAAKRGETYQPLDSLLKQLKSEMQTNPR